MASPKPRKPRKALSETDRARVVADVHGYAEANVQRQVQWVRDALVAAEAVAACTPSKRPGTALTTLYWIRLYAVMVDLRDAWGKHDSDRRELLGDVVVSENVRAIIDLWRLRLQPVEDLVSAFTADELTYIEYRRNSEAHPLEGGYRLQVRGDRTVIDTRERNLGPTLDYKDEQAVLSRVLTAYSRDEDAIAVVTAMRAIVPLRGLLTALLALT